jgi:hypothetical protein
MSMTIFSKRKNILHYLLALLFSTLLLSACGLSGERGGTNGRTSTGGGSDNGGGEDNDIFNIKEKIGIRVERINGDINGGQDKLSTTQISIVSLSEAFLETGSGSTPAFRVEERLIGGYEIQLEKSYIERVNQVVKVTFNNQTTPPEILYAPLYTLKNETESITVSAKSHYLLKKLFDSIDTSSQLSKLLPCSSSTITCNNQPMAKSNMLEQISIAVSAYNVDIPSSSTVAQAINILDQRLDLRQHIESAINEITRTQSPFAKGTRRSFDPIAAPITSQYYHSVYFGLSLSDIKPNDDNRSVKISSSSSTIINSSNNAYPSFSQTTSLLDMRRDVLSSDIPFERTNLEIAQNNNFTLVDNEDLNSLTSALTDSFLSTQGFLLNERVIEQTIPGGLSSTNPIGWEFEPLFSRSYQTNEYEPDPDALNNDDEEPDYGSAPTWLVSSNYSKAASFSLSGSGTSVKREQQLENVHLFSWEVHGLETNKDPGFTTSTMNGKDYGAISYSLKLNDENNTNVMQVIAETTKWSINSGTSSGNIQITQPSAYYETLSLSRNTNNSTFGVKSETNLIATRNITRLASNDSSYQGLVAFGGQDSGKPQGHSTANGSYIALAFNTKNKSDVLDRGQGIILASELVSFDHQFSDEIYQLQGNSFEMTDEKNIIHQLNGSSLEITSVTNIPGINCQATISIQRTSVEHTIGTQENTLSGPLETSQANVFSQSCTINDSELFIEFSGVFGEALTLRGFITQENDEFSNKPGNLINLLWQQDNQLGLVFANKELTLSPTFD